MINSLWMPWMTGEEKKLAGATDKMKDMAARRDSLRKSFIGEIEKAKALAPVADDAEDDLSSYL